MRAVFSPEKKPHVLDVCTHDTAMTVSRNTRRLLYRRGLERQQQLCRLRRNERHHAREDASRLESQLRAQQFPPKHACSLTPQLVYVLSGENGGVGLGCEFHGLALALAMSLRTNRTLVLAPSRWWLAGRGSGSGEGVGRGGRAGRETQVQWECGENDGTGGDTSGFECFFEHLSSCVAGESSDILEFTPGKRFIVCYI